MVQEIRASFYRKLFLAFVAATLVPGAGAGAARARLGGQPAARRRRGRRGPHGAHREARHRGVAGAAAARAGRRHRRRPQRRRDGVDQPHHRPGRQHLRRVRAAGHERARPVRVGPAADAHAGAGATAPSPSIGCRPTSARIGSATSPTSWRRRRSASAAATRSSPCRWRCASARSSARSPTSIARVLLGALMLILLGAGLGYWMAERIGDPVQRLTRATRRIAAGDLSTRVIVRTADELQRLVEAFNRMAGELQRQRSQLERTHRLEAWAEMARQVAHDIKNPLTPIQLSAEHLRRVHQRSRRAARRRCSTPASTRSSRRCGCCGRSRRSSRASARRRSPRPAPTVARRAAARGRRSLRASASAIGSRSRSTSPPDLPPVHGRSHAAVARRDQHPRERAARDAGRRHADGRRRGATATRLLLSHRRHRRRHGRRGARRGSSSRTSRPRRAAPAWA